MSEHSDSVNPSQQDTESDDELIAKKKGLLGAFEKIVDPMQELLGHVRTVVRAHRVFMILNLVTVFVLLVVVIVQAVNMNRMMRVERALEILLRNQEQIEKSADSMNQKAAEMDRKIEGISTALPAAPQLGKDRDAGL